MTTTEVLDCQSRSQFYKRWVLQLSLFFFFQAEDGIRDHCVTGVQTCALPIFGPELLEVKSSEDAGDRFQIGPTDLVAPVRVRRFAHLQSWRDEAPGSGVQIESDRKSVV